MGNTGEPIVAQPFDELHLIPAGGHAGNQQIPGINPNLQGLLPAYLPAADNIVVQEGTQEHFQPEGQRAPEAAGGRGRLLPVG